MNYWESRFDEQKRMLDGLLAKSPAGQSGIATLTHLNHQGLGFARQGRELEARTRFNFIEQAAEAIKDGKYEDFKRVAEEAARETEAGRHCLAGQEGKEEGEGLG